MSTQGDTTIPTLDDSGSIAEGRRGDREDTLGEAVTLFQRLEEGNSPETSVIASDVTFLRMNELENRISEIQAQLERIDSARTAPTTASTEPRDRLEALGYRDTATDPTLQSPVRTSGDITDYDRIGSPTDSATGDEAMEESSADIISVLQQELIDHPAASLYTVSLGLMMTALYLSSPLVALGGVGILFITILHYAR